MLGDIPATPIEGSAETGFDDDETPPDHEMAAAVDPKAKLIAWAQSSNIAPEIDADKLGEIGIRAKREYDIDENSRADWKTKTEQAMKLAMQQAEAKSYPWSGASNVIFPLVTSAAMQFAARAYPAVIPGSDVVKGQVVGSDDGVPMMGHNGGPALDDQGQEVWKVKPGTKRARADKVAEHMSWQLLDEMEGWETDTDTLLHQLPIVGCVFRKSYFDPVPKHNVSRMVPALNLVVNYHAKNIEIAPRLTELVPFYPIEIEENIRAGIWIDHDFGLAPGTEGDDDAPHEFLEQHRRLDLDDDGYAEPYIVTVHKETAKVVRIVARYDPDGIEVGPDGKITRIVPVQYYTQYDFLPNPEGGIYGLGLGHLLRPINESINTALNQMFDAGTLANTGGGFISKNLSMHGGSMRFTVGEYKPVNANGMDIRAAVYPIPFAGPSPVMLELLGVLINAGKEIASIKDLLSGDLPNGNVPATTVLAIITQGLKVFSAIYKRVFRSLKSEFAKLYRLNRLYLPYEMGYPNGAEWRTVTRDDYSQVSGVLPASDPAMVSDAQRLQQAQFLMQFVNDPHCDPVEILKRMFDAAMIERPEDLFAQQPAPNPMLVAEAAKIQARGHELDTQAAKQQSDAAVAVERQKSDASKARSEELKNLAQAVLALAQADAAVGAGQIAWISTHMEALRLQMEGLNAGSAPIAPDEGPGLGGMAPPPGDGSLAPVPQGLPASPAQ